MLTKLRFHIQTVIIICRMPKITAMANKVKTEDSSDCNNGYDSSGDDYSDEDWTPARQLAQIAIPIGM